MLLFIIWYYALTGESFIVILTPHRLDILAARFIASMMMHLNIEKDLRNGITMMKYAVNHYENFHNVYVAFFVAFLLTFSSYMIEVSIIMVLTSLPNVLEIIMKYVSLSAIANIPRFYYNSLVDYKLLMVSSLSIEIKICRRDN